MKFKVGSWWLKRWEDKYLRKGVVPRLPAWLQTYHLTLLTIPEAILCLVGGYLAKFDVGWLWLMNLGVIGHYVTDILDGELGRFRNTGLVRWGFYMDHMLDFLLLGSILTGYSFITPYEFKWVLFLVLVVCGAYFTHSILYFGATGKFEIAMFGFGPSEVRWVFVVVNTLLIFAGRLYLVWVLPWILGLMFVGVLWAVYKKQRELWGMDMREWSGKKSLGG